MDTMRISKFKTGERVVVARIDNNYAQHVGEGKAGTVIEDSDGRHAHVNWDEKISGAHSRGNKCTGNCYSVEESCLDLAFVDETNCPIKEEHKFLVKFSICPICGGKIKKEK